MNGINAINGVVNVTILVARPFINGNDFPFNESFVLEQQVIAAVVFGRSWWNQSFNPHEKRNEAAVSNSAASSVNCCFCHLRAENKISTFHNRFTPSQVQTDNPLLSFMQRFVHHWA